MLNVRMKHHFYYVIRHAISIAAAAVAAFITYKVALEYWFKNTFLLWIGTILLLGAVLVVGTEVNGSTRWIRIGGFTLQATSCKSRDDYFYRRLCGTSFRRSS